MCSMPRLWYDVVICDEIQRFPFVRLLSLSQSKTVLWRAHLDSGASIGVYTAGLDNPLKMFINLGFCRYAPVDRCVYVVPFRDNLLLTVCW